ncbi:integrase [Nonomuraea turkmeniaca]|uniref:Integrase n=1 Tax=Nonomuraea turkmeniaca TaxID=103838 RepID=A0A5S4EVX4_9ACTN|nr:tyrosine-type recombinase/integrase [Nonomuraea turkmeniaca]TMR07755.1 integrase [Nonomuraea turkmeniaca]
MGDFTAERAILPSSGEAAWVVVDAAYDLHAEACAFLAALRASDRSPNTERVYAGRVALYLSWCQEERTDWRRAGLTGLARFLSWLRYEPMPSRRRGGIGLARRRAAATADAVVATSCEFLRFCAMHGLADKAVVENLFEPRYLRFLPPGYNAGEDGQHRVVRSRTIKLKTVEKPFEWLRPEQVAALMAATRNVRDRFLVALVSTTGLRIGETLGLHRQDMHFLSSSETLGCSTSGPHLHVRRRPDNCNGALAKSRYPRSIPVPETVIDFYADYTHERWQLLGEDENPFVFVNLYRPPLGRAMSYPAAKAMFDRLAKATGIAVWPHLLRHTAATTMLRQGTPRDVVQEVLGHASPASMQPYSHVDDQDKRDAVERVARQARR